MITFKREVGTHRAEKAAIGKTAAAMVKDGDSVLFDGGSTTFYVAQALAGRSIHVITNSLPVAEVFSGDSSVDVSLLGGVLYPGPGLTLGALAEAQLKSFRPKWLFLGVGGIEPSGFSNSNLPLVETERAMMETAEHVVVVADSSKFGRQALARLGTLGEADYLVTDGGIPPSARQWIRQAGVELIIAGSGRVFSGKAGRMRAFA
jgi:DeoR/GlpR family transcriptional regulator of sugar metabolism